MLINQSVISDIKSIITQSKDNAIRAVDHQRTLMYWHIGKRIFEAEQEGKERADYGTYLIKYLSEQLQPEFGSGFSSRQMYLSRQLYCTFPIVNTLYSQLSWSQYKVLLRIDNQDKIEFYIAETIKNNWTVRQLERQIYSHLYERLLMSSDKESVLGVSATCLRKGTVWNQSAVNFLLLSHRYKVEGEYSINLAIALLLILFCK